jgi:hypothetical protein
MSEARAPLDDDERTATRLYRFGQLAAQVAAEPFPRRRQAQRSLLLRAAHELMGEAERLERLLTDGDAWLRAHGDVADFVGREDKWLGWLAQYEAIQDALRAGKESL